MDEPLDYIIRPICEQDRTKPFKTGNEAFRPLKSFLINQALQFQQHMVAQTYVACGAEGTSSENTIFGYITFTCSEVDIRNGYDMDDCPEASRYDSMPAIKIARLAVDCRYGRQGIGSALIDLALAISLYEIAPTVGCRFLITDAKQESVEFYQKCGFTALDESQFGQSDVHPIMFIDLYRAN